MTARLDQDRAHVGFMKFSNPESTRTEFFLTPARDVILDRKLSTDRIRFEGGSTDTSTAMRRVQDEIIRGPNNRDYVRDVVVLVTDGPPSQGDTSPQRLAIHASDLRNSGQPRQLKIVLVGVTGALRTYQNMRIAAADNDIVFSETFRDLRDKVAELLRDICPEPLSYGQVPGVPPPVYPPGKMLHAAWVWSITRLDKDRLGCV